jgi:cyclic pyranopterin phosphate synthase
MDLAFPTSPALRPQLTDAFGRVIDYLRLSVTDRCNLRCNYCMRGEVTFLPKADVLSLEEMETLCRAFIRLGVRKLRLTGGEPFARTGIMGLVERLGRRLESGELRELTLTTNGLLLARHAPGLARAGVRRINVSLDTLDPARFRAITGFDGLARVLDGIAAARACDIAVRVNTVALGGVNEDEYDRLLSWCGEQDCDMALIELMPIGADACRVPQRYLALDVVRRRLESRWQLEPLTWRSGGPADYVRVAATGRRLGFIAALSHGFCHECNRVRLSCAGTLVPCLAHPQGTDLRRVVRESDDDAALDAAIVAAVLAKPDAHHFSSIPVVAAPASRRMWQMGG